jgi:hypothetical protein
MERLEVLADKADVAESLLGQIEALAIVEIG